MNNRPHYVYVAASDRLLAWSKEEFDRVVVKVGISERPTMREIGLNGRHPTTGEPVPPCCGCSDWKVVAFKQTPTKNDAKNLEERFIAAFEPFDAYVRHAVPWPLPFKGAGESELLLFPEKSPVGAELARFDADVRDLYIAGRSGFLTAVQVIEPEVDDCVGDEELEVDRERGDHAMDAEHDRHEAQDRAALSRESGHFYED
ncbi:hypothetical protein NF699_07835 [Sphingomonadaceae bacterium OTU29LAMAA1]|nr:hypothetical protein NF699_07835 [Sphingomonadaceae bacterium OTU29LAMAA1]